MKQFLNSVWNFFEAMGQARAASVLARAGKINEAKAIYAK
jgi:hypothetical protein